MRVPILMPALSPTMEEGAITSWRVSVGDSVEPGDVIAEIETDKATMEVEAVDAGVIGEILAPAGSEGVKVNSEIAFLIEEGAEGADASPAPSTPQAAELAVPQEPMPEPSSAPAREEPHMPDWAMASPLAMRLAKHSGVDLIAIAGSGPNGRIVKRDIERAASGVGLPAVVASQSPAAVPISAKSDQPSPVQGDYTAVPLTGMRRSIATRLRQSFNEAPHFPLTIDCNLGALLDLRRILNDEAEDTKISINDFFIRISALALQRVPAVNTSYTEDSILHHKHADIAVAVAIDGGLIAPIIRKAETKGLRQISDEMKALALRARDNQLAPEDYQGGTFSVSNLGMYGVKTFSSILNPPQGAILSIGAAQERAVISDGAVASAMMLSLTLTCDHRAMDGTAGAQFLAVFKDMVEDPICMLL